jgi:hypothetical protein
MVDCCVNPECRADFRQFNSGDLYALERRAANTEFFWLCSECAPQFDLLLDVAGRLSFRPRGERGLRRPDNPDRNLRLVSRAATRNPWRDAVPADEPRAFRKFGERRELAS